MYLCMLRPKGELVHQFKKKVDTVIPRNKHSRQVDFVSSREKRRKRPVLSLILLRRDKPIQATNFSSHLVLWSCL